MLTTIYLVKKMRQKDVRTTNSRILPNQKMFPR